MDLSEARRHARAAHAVIRLHELTCPARSKPTEPVEPAPAIFAGHSVPHDVQIAMAERQSVAGFESYQLAEEFDYPVEVVELVLSKLKGQYVRELLRRQSPWN